jgi:hypothetical protein
VIAVAKKKPLGKTQTSVLCRLQHRTLQAHGAVSATLRSLQKKRLAKVAYSAKGGRGRSKKFLKLTPLGRKRASQICS